MKTTDKTELKPDPVMAELRLAKETLAQRHDFDVVAMVRSLRDREEKDASLTIYPKATQPSYPSLKEE